MTIDQIVSMIIYITILLGIIFCFVVASIERISEKNYRDKKENKKMIRKKDLLERIKILEEIVYGEKRHSNAYLELSCGKDNLIESVAEITNKVENLQRDHDQLVKVTEPILAREAVNALDELGKELENLLKDFLGGEKETKKPATRKKAEPQEPAKKSGGKGKKGE